MKSESSHDRTLRMLDGFERLADGWCYGEGGPLPPETTNAAASLVRTGRTLGYAHSDAFPGLSGEVMVVFYGHGHCIEITLQRDLSVNVIHEAPGRDDVEFDFPSPESLGVKLEEWLVAMRAEEGLAGKAAAAAA